MEKLSDRKAAVLEVLDAQIDELEAALRKVQPKIDELNQLKRTRATLLNERSTTGSLNGRTRLTMEQVIHALREAEGVASVDDLAKTIGVDTTVVRSHLNRYKDVRYRKDSDGDWELIGYDDEEGK